MRETVEGSNETMEAISFFVKLVVSNKYLTLEALSFRSLIVLISLRIG